MSAGSRAAVSFSEASRFWLRLGWISFGGPAAQIAILQRELVEQKRWIDPTTFRNALSVCMLLPGPEALQLAIYLGWRLHGARGGLVAGLGFCLPAIAILLLLSVAYVRFGQLPLVMGLLHGLNAVVIALVVQALLRLGRHSLDSVLQATLAVATLLGLRFLGLPFAAFVAFAGLLGFILGPPAGPALHGSAAATLPAMHASRAATARTLGIALLLWCIPLAAALALAGTAGLPLQVYLFFTQVALVTFGGAYAVLGFVTEQVAGPLAWLSATQAVAGLALAESTPGPLVIVLQFFGFMAGWNQPGDLAPLTSAIACGLLAATATFLPAFAVIFMAAPYIELLAQRARLAAALHAISAVVVGSIANLAVTLVLVVLWPRGSAGPLAWEALVLAVGAFLVLTFTRVALPWVLAAGALGGLLTTFT